MFLYISYIPNSLAHIYIYLPFHIRYDTHSKCT
ncbi:hypothetical protein F383_19157 [Gossypium arboreum]|uniref:Uncharacterized protein n=1 Tax=Gossypium arboreum TaxID=29729 RepID=A0A0B0MI18_GOSAR|nr:hypothetical protein F383_19157 [Gossypium arboreum]